MTIELSMVIRDKFGNPMSRKECISDEGAKISEFWNNNRLHKKSRKLRDKGGILSEQDAHKLLEEIFGEEENNGAETA